MRRACTRTAWVLLLLAAAPMVAAELGGWRAAEQGHVWSFPRDHFSHPGYKMEWWYVTGHLESVSEPRRRFGYQFTLFRIGLTPGEPDGGSAWSASNVMMGHAAVSDLDRDIHRFGELLYREVPFLGEFVPYAPQTGAEAATIAWTRGPVGTDDRWRIGWNGEGFDFEATDRQAGFGYRLSTRAARPLIFQGPGGVSRKAAEGGHASLYYSFTRLETTGELTVDGETFEVRGESWMDKEFGSGQLARHQSGWDWFSLQLADGRDLMLYVLRGQDDGIDFARGTLVGTDGTVRYLDRDDWTLTSTGSWSSEATGIGYPSGWSLAVPTAGLNVVIQPEFAAQENVSGLGNIAYWEGAVTVRDAEGRPQGAGYVELTGYGRGNRPGI